MDTCALLFAAAFHAEANLRALIESTKDIIWSVDLNQGLLAFNRAFHDHMERSFGVRVAAGMRAEDMLPPEIAALWPPLYQRVLSEGPFQAEYSLIDGRTLELSFNPIVQDGETRGISVFGKDITERKTAEAKLREAEEKYQGIFEGALEGIYRTSLEGKNLAANPAMAKMLGYASEQEVVAAITDTARHLWLDPNERSHVLQLLEEHGVVREYECQWKRKDGTAIWVSLNCRNVRGKDGRALYNEGFVEDITERKEVAARLQAQQKRFQSVIENTDAGFYRIGIDGCYEDVNPAWLRMHGFTRREDAIGLHFSAVQAPEDVGKAGEVVEGLMRGGSARSGVFSRLRRDGTIGYHSYSANPVLDGDRMIGVEGFMVDITEQKRAEEALRQTNRKLHQLSKDLLRSQDYERRRIARELHDSTAQLLAALSINLGRLRDSELEASRREQVLSEAIDLAAACSAEIRTTTYLLHPPLLEEVGLADALQAYVQGFYQRTGIEVEVIIPPVFGRLGSEMEVALFRIIQEGLANVHKHSGSRLAVLRLERDSREVRLVVQDEGRGLPTALLPWAKGFVHFGIGLAGMLERAEQLGGRLELASGDAGTRLTVTLPMVHSNEETADIVGG
jgi:PAS domain S-box-containing protein